MSVRKIELLDENKFPRAVRVAINAVIRRINRPVIFRLADDFALAESTTEESEEKSVVTLPRGRGAGITTTVPFRCAKIDDTTIRVYRGSVTSGGTFTAPGFNSGDAPIFTLSVSGSGVIYMSVTVDGTTGAVTDANNPDHASSVPADSDPDFYKELGSYSTSGGVLTVQTNDIGDQNFILCGGATPEWWT